MRLINQYCWLGTSVLLVALARAAGVAAAETAAVQAQVAAGSSVEDNMRAMDGDEDGQVSVLEVRTFIQARHGLNYQAYVLDEMASSAYGKSCATPFAQPLY